MGRLGLVLCGSGWVQVAGCCEQSEVSASVTCKKYREKLRLAYKEVLCSVEVLTAMYHSTRGSRVNTYLYSCLKATAVS